MGAPALVTPLYCESGDDRSMTFGLAFGRGRGLGLGCFFGRFAGFKTSSSSSDVNSMMLSAGGFFVAFDFRERILARSAMSSEYTSASIGEKSGNVVVAVCMLSRVAAVPRTVDGWLICGVHGASDMLACMDSSGLSEGFFFTRGLGRGLGFEGTSAVRTGEIKPCDSPGGVKSDAFEMSRDWRARSGVWGREGTAADVFNRNAGLSNANTPGDSTFGPLRISAPSSSLSSTIHSLSPAMA